MDATEPVNLMKSMFVCNTFNFLYAASKACLFPFITLYLRLLGLTATQTGIIIGGKTISAFIFAPLWAMCSARFRKRRLVLMFSILMMAATYLGLTLIMNVNKAATSCNVDGPPGKITGTLQELVNNIKNSRNETQTFSTNMSQNLKPGNLTTNPSPVPSFLPSTTDKSTDIKHLFEYGRKLLMKMGLSQSDVKDIDDSELISLFEDMLSRKGWLKLVREKLTPEEMEEFYTFLNKAVAAVNSGDIDEVKKPIRKRSLQDSWENFKTNLKSLQQNVKSKLSEAEEEGQIFLIILFTLVLGEMLCSPVEKIADDAWFDFLENIDNLEKYGKQRIFTSLAFIIFPLIVTLIVDNTTCLFSLNIHPIALHFYMFGGFLGLTFLVAFFYPMSGNEKRKYKTKVVHAFSLTCCRCEGFLYTTTLLLVGAIYASYNNYLFWLIQDLQGKELTMGLCISIANLAEIPMLFFSGPLVRKLGNGMAMCFSLVCLAGRTIFYSYLWTPWAVLPAELTHAFTHTVMWYSVLSNPVFNTNPTIDRAVRSVFSSVYFGVGFSAGSILSGIIYDMYGVNILFRACAIVAISWCPIFAVVQRCCARQAVNEIKYTRLLTTEDVNSDSDDDWLEHALKTG